MAKKESAPTISPTSGMIRLVTRKGNPEYISPGDVTSIVTTDGKGAIITRSGRWIECPQSADELHAVLYNSTNS